MPYDNPSLSELITVLEIAYLYSRSVSLDPVLKDLKHQFAESQTIRGAFVTARFEASKLVAGWRAQLSSRFASNTEADDEGLLEDAKQLVDARRVLRREEMQLREIDEFLDKCGERLRNVGALDGVLGQNWDWAEGWDK